MVESTMDAVAWLRKQLEDGNEDLLREMVSTFAERVMSAEVDELCGASYHGRLRRRLP